MKSHTHTAIVFALLILMVFLLTSCLPGTTTQNQNTPAGFLMGIWHGWIAPISLIAGLFNPEISIYEPVNTGWWYDFGFYMAIISGFGGLSLARKGGGRKSSSHTS